jgi:hypothetical protein
MIGDLSGSNDSLGLNCIALYKIAKEKGYEIPIECVHMYLAGLINEFESPKKSEVFSKFVVNSVDELTGVIKRYEFDPQPHAVPFLVSKYSGDYHINLSAVVPEIRDTVLPSVCYSNAQFFARKMGEPNAKIYGLLALDPEKYILLLSAYYQFVRNNPNFEITDKDYLNFKKDISDSFNQEINIKPPTKVKQKTDHSHLI